MSEAASCLGSRAVRVGPAVPLLGGHVARAGGVIGGGVCGVCGACGVCGVGGVCGVAIIDLRAHFKVFFCRRWFLIFLPYV